MIESTKWLIIKGILLVCLSFVMNTMAAQLVIKIENSTITSEQDLYNISIVNDRIDSRQVLFHIQILNKGISIYDARTGPQLMSNRYSRYTFNTLSPIDVSRNDLRSMDLKENKSLIIIKLIDGRDLSVIGQLRESIDLSQLVYSDTGSKQRKGSSSFISDNFSTNGSINISGQWSDQPGRGSAVPRSFGQINGNATLNFSELPVDLSFLASTQHSGLSQSINRANVSLNITQLKSNLKQRLQDKVDSAGDGKSEISKAQLQQFKQELLNEEYPSYQSLKSRHDYLESADMISDVMKVLEIQKILKNKGTIKNAERLSELQGKQEGLDINEKREFRILKKLTDKINMLKWEEQAIQEAYPDDLQSDILVLDRYIEANEYYESLSIKDYRKANRSINVFSLLNKTQQLLEKINAVSIGINYPHFSKYTLNGVSVNGFHFAGSHSNWYFETSIGNSARESFDTRFSIPNLTLRERILAFKTGYGDPADDHIHLTFADLRNSNSEFQSERDQARANRIVGIEGSYSLLSGALTIEGELVGSLFTGDKDGDLLSENVQIENPIPFLFGSANSTSSFDNAYRIGANYDLRDYGLRISGELEKLGSSFQSLGAPTLLNNLVRWNGDISKSLLNNQIQLSLNTRRENNALNPFVNTINSTTESYGGSIAISIPSAPQIFASYAPFAQSNEVVSTGEVISSSTSITSIAVSYPYSITESFNGSTQVSYNAQESTNSSDASDILNRTFGLSQSVTVNQYGFNSSINYSPDQLLGLETQDVLNVNASLNYSQDKFRSNVGYQLLKIPGKESKVGFQGGASYSFSDLLTLDFRVQRNIYEPLFNSNSFRDVIVNGGLRINFNSSSKGKK